MNIFLGGIYIKLCFLKLILKLEANLKATNIFSEKLNNSFS